MLKKYIFLILGFTNGYAKVVNIALWVHKGWQCCFGGSQELKGWEPLIEKKLINLIAVYAISCLLWSYFSGIIFKTWRLLTWSQSFKKFYGVLTPLFFAQICELKFEPKFTPKTSFVVIPTAQNRFIGLKKLFILITQPPKFWRWGSLFFRIDSCYCFIMRLMLSVAFIQYFPNLLNKFCKFG
jgi:hypothetical protein